MDNEQAILGELRAIRRQQTEMDVRLKVDAANSWQATVAKALEIARLIPPGARWCLLAGVVVLTGAIAAGSVRWAAIGVDLCFLALLFIGGTE